MSRTLQHWRGGIWVLPAVVLVGLFVYYPILDNIRLSLFSWNAFSARPRFVGLENYRAAAGDPVFWHSLLNNTAYAVVSLVLQVGFSLVLAAVLEEFVHRRLRGILRTIYFVPAVISITVAGILFSFLYNPQIGLLNHALAAVGLDGWTHAWLGEQSTAIWSVIAMSQWQSIGYTAVLFVVAVQRIPRELYESARVDGASPVRTFFAVTVPMVREMTTLLIILTISGAFLVFNEVQVMTAGGPSDASQVLGTWLYRNAFLADNMGYASAIATVIFVITFGIAAVQIAVTRPICHPCTLRTPCALRSIRLSIRRLRFPAPGWERSCGDAGPPGECAGWSCADYLGACGKDCLDDGVVGRQAYRE